MAKLYSNKKATKGKGRPQYSKGLTATPRNFATNPAKGEKSTASAKPQVSVRRRA